MDRKEDLPDKGSSVCMGVISICQIISGSHVQQQSKVEILSSLAWTGTLCFPGSSVGGSLHPSACQQLINCLQQRRGGALGHSKPQDSSIFMYAADVHGEVQPRGDEFHKES
jgi:hypothetical protein